MEMAGDPRLLLSRSRLQFAFPDGSFVSDIYAPENHQLTRRLKRG